MLQHILGDEIFFKGIKYYYKTYMNGNALTKDFEAAMEKVSGKKLAWFFDEWIYKPGLPYLSGGWQYSYKSRQLVVKIKQVQEDGNIFRMPLDLGIYSENGKRIAIKKVEINSGTNEFKFSLKHKPLKVVLDPNIWMLMSSDFKEE